MSVNQAWALKIEGESESLSLEVLTKKKYRLVFGRTSAGKVRYKKTFETFFGKDET